MYYIINRSALLMNFDTKKRLFRLLLERKKGRKFFLFLSSFCENAESLGAVEKLSHRSTPTQGVFLFVRNDEK